MTINQFSELEPSGMLEFLKNLDSKKNPPVWALQFRHSVRVNMPKLVAFNNKLSIAFERLVGYSKSDI